MIPVIRSTVLAFADMFGAVAKTGVRAHAAYLILAEVVSSLLQARPGPLVIQHIYLAAMALSASSMHCTPWPGQQNQSATSVCLLGCRYCGRGRSAAQLGARAACPPSMRGSS